MKHIPTEKQLSGLRPFNTMSDDERQAMNARGGRKAGETKRERKKCAEILKILVDKIYKDKKGAKADGREVLMVSLFNKAVKEADIPAMKLILNLLGEMPTPNLNLNVDKDATDNGMLNDLLQANLKIQKQIMRERDEQTGTECPDENS